MIYDNINYVSCCIAQNQYATHETYIKNKGNANIYT